MMRRVRLFFLAVCCAPSFALAQPAPAAKLAADAVLNRFLAVWSGDGHIDPGAVDELYANRVVYYGAPVGKAEILRQKQEVGARLRGHSYHLVPGTARSSCDPSGDRCHLTGVLEWRAGHGSGSATLALDLARIDGVLKVVREGGNVIARGRCGATGCGYHLPSLR